MAATSGNATSAVFPHSKNRTAKVIGILNIAISTAYAVVVISSPFGMSPHVRFLIQQGDTNFLLVVELLSTFAVNLVFFLGLLVSGIELLRGRVRGRSFLRVTAILLAIYEALDTCFIVERIVIMLGSRMSTALAVVFLGLTVTGIRLAYPVAASLILSSSPKRLGLR